MKGLGVWLQGFLLNPSTLLAKPFLNPEPLNPPDPSIKPASRTPHPKPSDQRREATGARGRVSLKDRAGVQRPGPYPGLFGVEV